MLAREPDKSLTKLINVSQAGGKMDMNVKRKAEFLSADMYFTAEGL